MKASSWCLLFLLVFSMPVTKADDQVPNWSELRQKRADIYYPHEPHYPIMQELGDACMLCHSFGGNTEHELSLLQKLNDVANEPLESICHSCHVDKRQAPSRCDVCHTNPQKVWPSSHDYDYIHTHSTEAIVDENSCKECHLAVSFCTDCHFSRGSLPGNEHPLGYINSHGIEARMNVSSCSTCHSAAYCSECHEQP